MAMMIITIIVINKNKIVIIIISDQQHNLTLHYYFLSRQPRIWESNLPQLATPSSASQRHAYLTHLPHLPSPHTKQTPHPPPQSCLLPAVLPPNTPWRRTIDLGHYGHSPRAKWVCVSGSEEAAHRLPMSRLLTWVPSRTQASSSHSLHWNSIFLPINCTGKTEVRFGY